MLVFRGRVLTVRSHGYSVVKTKTALLRVFWAGGELPPDIYAGSLVCAVGKVITYDNGRDWRVSDALPLVGEDWSPMMKPIYERLFLFAADPAEWCPKEVINMYRYRRQFKPPTS